jgi:hypothetical protein
VNGDRGISCCHLVPVAWEVDRKGAQWMTCDRQECLQFARLMLNRAAFAFEQEQGSEHELAPGGRQDCRSGLVAVCAQQMRQDMCKIQLPWEPSSLLGCSASHNRGKKLCIFRNSAHCRRINATNLVD